MAFQGYRNNWFGYCEISSIDFSELVNGLYSGSIKYQDIAIYLHDAMSSGYEASSILQKETSFVSLFKMLGMREKLMTVHAKHTEKHGQEYRDLRW